MVQFVRSDLEFILEQIRIAERNALGESLTDILPSAQVPFGLRTVDGSFNNLAHPEFGAADLAFPRLTDPSFRPAEAGTNYATPGFVQDSQPRTISNLVVDQTNNNPAAVAATQQTPGSSTVTSPGLDGIFGTADDRPVNFIPNITPDVGLSAPFNAWMTFFGQFFDHGLDLVTKSTSQTEVVFIPLKPDDPLFSTAPGALNFMVLNRAAGGQAATNTTSPFVDQSQTYASNPSHQVFLRAYELNTNGDPVATGELITNRNLGADGRFGTADDVEIGGMATWAVVKAQARDILGINLTDADVGNVPVLAVDAYGNFIVGPNGMPMVMMTDGSFTEGSLAAPISLAGAARTGHAFLNDIAHNADPTGKTADADSIVNTGPLAAGQYDNELLDAHYMAGDGRVNENIGLTAVHAVFHSEHNRLVQQTKDVALATGDLAFLNQWLDTPLAVGTTFPLTQAQIDALDWNGERLFQAAKFGTEMQYQHLVFEEFARTVQPQVDEFLAPNGYDTTINPAILAEFAHTVYRFGHSMLTETVDRFDPNFNTVGGDPQLGLIAAFLNPLAYAASGVTPEQATGAIVRGVTRQVGNEIDEFVTEAVRNNLLGLPLDLPALNIARGRDTGIPSLNQARVEFFAMTGDSQLKPYISWSDFAAHLKHAESLINFIAAYGTHVSITSATTLAAKRAAATLLVLDGVGAPTDRLDFLNATGAYSGGSLGGLNDVDFWIGGLAEAKMPFGGMLGSTFNFVFETQLESLQNGDRFYYLSRTAGMNFGTELENNSFAKLVMLNSDATHLPNAIFTTPTFTLEVNQAAQHTGLGLDGRADPTGGIEINGIEVVPLVIRDNPATAGADTNYLQYTGEDHVVLGGTAGDDVIISGDGDDTLYGDGGNDYLEGGYGNDTILGGAGDDIIRDLGGDDRLEGGDGNDVIHAGNMMVGGVGNLILGGAGKDYIVTMEDISTTFGGQGDDFIYSAKTSLPPTGNEGDDWIEKGTQDGAPGDNFAPLLADNVIGNDIFIGGGGFDEFIGEGGDDIFVGSDAQDKMDGMSGFDWVTYKNDTQGVTVDLTLAALAQPHGETPAANTGIVQPVGASPASILDRFAEVEGLSGSRFADILRGDDVDAVTILNHGGATGGALTNVALINNLVTLLAEAGLSTTGFATGNIMLGGAGSDIIEGRGGDDLIDGDRWLNVRISVRANIDGTGAEIATFDSMVAPTLLQNMLNGVWNPGQLVAVREIIDDNDAFDTAVYSGNLANYTITTAADGTTTVTDNVGTDGTDTLRNVERLQFADQSFTLPNGAGLNVDPIGQLTILDAASTPPTPDDTPTSGQLLRVSIAGVTDADTGPGAVNGIIPGSISYHWQFETAPGSGIFEDIILLPLGDLAFQSADGTTFRVTPDLVGASLRVKAIFTDGHGVTETVFSAPTQPVAAGAPVPPPVAPTPVVDATSGGEGIMLVRSDLNFILDQIKIAEANAAGTPLTSLLPNVRVPLGLRTVDGSGNNLGTQQQSETFGAADNVFPRVTTPVFNTAEGGTSYQQTSGLVIDSQPRTISNLVVDQTMNNPAAIAAALRNAGSENIAADTTTFLNGLQALNTAKAGADPVAVATAQLAFDGIVDRLGLTIVTSPGLDGTFGTADDKQVFEIPNIAPDAGLSAPFNAWMTFFGQFFDHGLDLVTKGGSGTVFIPLQPDDPLFVPGSPTNFMVLTRATNQPGPDGVLGTADDIHEHTNTTTPFVDQNQTYSSHPSHQVFLRAYELNAAGDPVATGRLITNRDLGADGRFGTADDVEIGGMATWKVLKAQARDILGINLTDADFDNAPLLATDAYGNFIKGPNGFPQVVMKGPDGLGGTADDVLVEGNPAAPVNLATAVRTGHAFLNDIAHNAVPVFNPGGGADGIANTADDLNPAAYDTAFLDAHYMAGDGRVNENIGLTTVHAIFHSEHNRLVEQAKNTVLASGDVAFLQEWLIPGTEPATFPTDAAAIAALQWNGERLFQTAKFGTEMQYQHLVFEEFARTIQPNIDLFFAPTQVYDVDLDPSIVAEFAHTVYRFGHSMLTETIDRFDANFNVVQSDPNNPDQQIGLIAAFLNPLAFAASGPTPEEAVSAIVRGVTRQAGNEIDEFVTEALRNNLLGLPLDLPTINLARGRDVGIPSLNEVRRQIYTQTGEVQLKPYTSWVDLIQSLKHADSVINFIAAYGTHTSITGATTLADKRAAATLLVLGGVGEPADRLDFLNGTGAWASAADGVTITGVDDIDLWIGGLAEEKMPFGGMLGSTFNFIFENQLEKLQDGDRFYYLERTAGLSFNAELESNSFAKLIMANTEATHLPGVVFTTPGFTLEVNQAAQHTGLGADGRADPFTPEAAFADPTFQLAAFGPNAGWSSQDGFPRAVADVNGDGRADIVGFAQSGVQVSLANADGTFQAPIPALAAFGPAFGWSSQDGFPRALADVNGDGRADVVGFAQSGVQVALANADGTFQAPIPALAAFGQNAGWSSQDGFPRALADVNGDGRADVVGFAQGGVQVALANADGTFQTPIFALAAFGSAFGWSSQDRFPRALADVNGDGRADVVGFAQGGVQVALANADGTFQTPIFALANFTLNAGGWTSQSLFPRLVVDVNGDGLADIVGFGPAGVQVALSNGDGTFQAPTFELHAFSTLEGGWSSQNAFPRDIADVNGDGLADIVGFGPGGVLVAFGQGGPLVIRDNPATVGPDTNFLHYTGEDHVVLGGTAADDIIMSGDGDDTLWGDAGNDRLDGGAGNDQLRGGAGDDIITDTGGDDNIQGGDGNDVLHGGNGVNLIIGGFGSDFIVTGEDASEAIGGQGNDFILGSKANEQDMGNEGDDWIEKGTSDGAPGDNFDPLGNDPVIGNDVFIGDGENDKFNGEGGDDIMAGKVGFGDRYIGGSGYDWAIYKYNTTGVTIDISDRFFDQPPVPGGSTSLSRFDFVEGLSGSSFGDVLSGDDSSAATLPTAGATGSVLTNIDLIAGLRDLLPAGATFFDGGNIILGGAGSDIIQGRGGNDIIDGDRWLNVRISVRANIDGTGPEIASFDSMEPMVPFMLNGTYNPGQLVIVREILTSATADVDTAKFSGVRANYTITTNADGSVTVTDNVGTDGTDTLRNIERLEFADQSIVLGGTNNEPVGQPAIVDVNGGSIQVGDVLTADLTGLSDADNPGGTVPAFPVSYFWQVDDGTGTFDDILTFGAGEVERAHSPSFTVTDAESGLALRLRVVYQDANGVLEEVFSTPTAAVSVAPVPTIITGTAAADTLLGTAGPDIISAGAGNDLITIASTAGRDIIDGGADTDTVQVLGDATTEAFQIFAAADATAAGFTLDPATQIAIVRNGLVIAELANIEEIVITSGGGGDTFQVIGNFAPTTLLTNTITLDGSAGDDTVNISALTSAHRIVFKSMGGHDTIIGALRPQDVIELAPGSTLANYTSTNNGNGTTTLTNGSHTITFATLPGGALPTFVDAGSTGGSGGGDGITGAFELTAGDVAGLKLLVNGQEVPGDDDTVPGVRDLSGHGNNVAHPDFGAADEHFIRLTEARFGEFDPTINNNKVNPIFDGLDPRNISNILGVQEADLPKNGNDANIFFMAFGQYFDHGLDFLPKGGNGTIQIGAPGNGAPGSGNPADLTRGTVDEIVNGVPQHINRTSPFADQNQAYGSNGLVGQFLREGDGDGGLGSMLLAGAPDPSDPDFRLLPTLRELILEHWENNTVFTGLPGGPVNFRTYFAGLVDGNGVINTTMAATMASNFMGTGHALLLDANPFISVLDHYIAGDGRANENFALTAMHTIWARNHNFHVQNLVEAGFQGTQEELFQAAKIINEAEYQRVVFDEFADHLIGGIKGDGSHGHGDYNPDATAAISHEFAAAVYRVGHSLIGQTMTVLDADGQPKQVALFDAFLNPTNESGAFTAPLPPGYVPQPGYEQLGVDSILGGIIRQPAEEVDFNIVDAVRNDLVRINADLFAFNVARGWDVGLGTLNQVRADLAASQDPYVSEAVGYAGNLSPYTSWEDFQQRNNLSDAVIAQFKQAYPDLVLDANEIAAFKAINSNIDVAIQADGTGIVKGIDRVDLWVGGLAETHINGGMVGQTFWVVLHEQFDRLQEADRFYYLDRVENFDFYENFIDGQEFADIIARNTSLTNLPENIFETLVGDDGGDVMGSSSLVGDPILLDGEATNAATHDDLGSGSDTTALADDSGSGTDGSAHAGTMQDDVLTGTAGDDLIDGDTGDDRITADAGDDTVVAGAGNDVIVATAGDGNDVYFGDDSDGGTGSDTLDMSAITANLTVDLGNGLLGRGSAVSTDSGTDTLWSIENVATGSGNDTITASVAVNVMEGGAGNDTFRFLSKEAADGDTILDFEPGDKLDLSGIDANTALTGDQSFTLTSGPAFTATAQLVVSHETRADGDYTVVKGNVDGDADADFQINLKGNHTLTGGNFTL